MRTPFSSTINTTMWILCLLFCGLKFSQASNQSCSDALKELIGAVRLPTVKELESSTKKSVEFAGTFHGLSQEEGHQSLLVRRIGDQWASFYQEHHYDFQGDPRWFISLLGERQAEYLGFRLLDDYTMVMPNPKALVDRIQKITQKIEGEGKKPSVEFYEQKEFILRKYIEQFILPHNKPALPLAESGNHYVHDVSFHLGALFLPEELLSFHRERYVFREKFFDYAAQKWGIQTNLTPAQKLERALGLQLGVSEKANKSESMRQVQEAYHHWFRFEESKNIDLGTGNLTVELLKASQDLRDGRTFDASQSSIKRALQHFYSDDLPVSTELHQDYLRIKITQDAIKDLFEKFTNPEYRIAKKNEALPVKTYFPKTGESAEEATQRIEKVIEEIITILPVTRDGLVFPEKMSMSKVKTIVRDMLSKDGMTAHLEEHIIEFVEKELKELEKPGAKGFRIDLPMHKVISDGKGGREFSSEEDALRYFCSQITQKRKAFVDALEDSMGTDREFAQQRSAWLDSALDARGPRPSVREKRSAVENEQAQRAKLEFYTYLLRNDGNRDLDKMRASLYESGVKEIDETSLQRAMTANPKIREELRTYYELSMLDDFLKRVVQKKGAETLKDLDSFVFVERHFPSDDERRLFMRKKYEDLWQLHKNPDFEGLVTGYNKSGDLAAKKEFLMDPKRGWTSQEVERCFVSRLCGGDLSAFRNGIQWPAGGDSHSVDQVLRAKIKFPQNSFVKQIELKTAAGADIRSVVASELRRLKSPYTTEQVLRCMP